MLVDQGDEAVEDLFRAGGGPAGVLFRLVQLILPDVRRNVGQRCQQAADDLPLVPLGGTEDFPGQVEVVWTGVRGTG